MMHSHTRISVIHYREGGRIEDAIILYKKAIAADPNYVEAYNNLGGLYINIGRDKEAIDVLSKVITVNPNTMLAYINLGIAYRNIGKNEEAIMVYKKAIEIDPSFADAYFALAGLSNSRQEAQKLYEKAIHLLKEQGKEEMLKQVEEARKKQGL